MSTTVHLMFPVGRLVSGSPYKLVTKDDKGQPMEEKKHHWSIGYAIPKCGTTDWKTQTDWGRTISATAATDWPNGESKHPAFSFKVKDGDAGANPNKIGSKANSDKEGWAGNWIVFFRRGKQIGPVPMVNANGSENFALRAQEQIKKGDYVQVYGSCKGSNGTPANAGCYINDEVLAFIGKGQEIVSSDRPDPTKLGFGGALPAGATAPVNPIAPAGNAAAAPPAVQQVAVQPYAAFLTPGVPAAAPALPPSAPALAPVRQMTAKAGGIPYEDFLRQNWTDELLRQHGYMV